MTTQTPAERLLILARRRDYVITQIAERGERPGFDFRAAEREALDWAIGVLTPMFTSRPPGQAWSPGAEEPPPLLDNRPRDAREGRYANGRRY